MAMEAKLIPPSKARDWATAVYARNKKVKDDQKSESNVHNNLIML